MLDEIKRSAESAARREDRAATQDAAQTRAEAVEFFRKQASAARYYATDKGGRGYDATSVHLLGAPFLQRTENNGCKVTFASNEAHLGALVEKRQGWPQPNTGYGFVTIDWGRVEEIDASGIDVERGLLVRGGIIANFGPKPVVRIDQNHSGSGWAWYTKIMQRICRAEQTGAR